MTSVDWPIRYSGIAKKCTDYWIMLHCGKEKGPNLDPFPSHNAALSNNQCIFCYPQYTLCIEIDRYKLRFPWDNVAYVRGGRVPRASPQ